MAMITLTLPVYITLCILAILGALGCVGLLFFLWLIFQFHWEEQKRKKQV